MTQATASSSIPTVPIKKNRIEEPSGPSSTESATSVNDDSTVTENNTEETRKEVEKLSHEEKKRNSKLLTVDEEDQDDAASVNMEGSIHEPEAETGRKRKMLERAESANVVNEESVKRIKEDDLEVSLALPRCRREIPRYLI